MDYAALSSAIQNFSESDEQAFVAAIPTFIRTAEQRIYNSVQIAYLRKNVTGFTTPNNRYLSTPSDFLSVYSLAVIKPNGEYEYLLNKDVNFIRQAYPSPNDKGLPKYYAIFGPTTTSSVPPVITNELSLLLGPSPDSNYNMELHYFFYPEGLT